MALPHDLESCTRCPHVDQFHSSCNHPLRQIVIRELSHGMDECPLYDGVKAEAMSNLESELDDVPNH